MGNFFPTECVKFLSVGTGVAGITMNLARAACLLIFGDSDD